MTDTAHERWHRRWHRRFRHSLHGRLVALFLVLALGSTALFVGGTQRVVGAAFELFVKPLLADYGDRLAEEIGSPPDIARAQALTQRLPLSIRIEGPLVQWRSPSRRDAAPARHADDERDERAALTRRTADGHTLYFGVDGGLWQHPNRWRAWVPVAGLLVLTGLAFAVVRRLLRPLDDIRVGAERYGRGEFGEPIPVRRRDELGALAQQVNAMAQGLEGMLGSQRELLLAISHELRSPLTRARLNAELLPEGPERTALLRDLAAMRELISQLLESERLAAGSAALQREPTTLDELVRGVLQADFAGQPVDLELPAPLPPLSLDRARVQLLLRNLVDNALRHGAASAEQPVTVRVERVGDAVRLGVRDRGPGVGPAQLARLAQPFYRPEDARTRAGGGVGLGLYLCRRVALSHGARWQLLAADPGLEVRVEWPL